MRPDDLYVDELFEAAQTVRRYMARGGPEWIYDEIVRDAVLHRLIVIGEIAGAVSADLRARHPEVPWARVRAFRNTAIHEYFAVDWVRVRRIAVDEVPTLEQQVLAIIKCEFPEIAKRYEEGT